MLKPSLNKSLNMCNSLQVSIYTTPEYRPQEFAGEEFYFATIEEFEIAIDNLDEDLGREEIFITTSFVDDSNRAEPGALVYRSSAQEKTFKKDLWGRWQRLLHRIHE